MPKLKVFCTTSGFYDHLVAAPSRPAALKAWGAKTDLFSMGVARQVTDPRMEKKALERPGEVIRVKRSGEDEGVVHIKKRSKTGRRPNRARLDAAEKRMAEIEVNQSGEARALEKQLASLQNERDALARRHEKERGAAARKAEEALDAYNAALADWTSR
jgi:hypothetical protein